MLPITNGLSASPTSLGSSSCGMSDFQLPSLYQLLVVNANSAIDYFKDAKVNNGVVDNPPTKVVNLICALLLSPLNKYKQLLECRQDTSPSQDDDNTHQGPIMCLCMEAPPCGVTINPILCPLHMPPITKPACVDGHYCLSLYTLLH